MSKIYKIINKQLNKQLKNKVYYCFDCEILFKSKINVNCNRCGGSNTQCITNEGYVLANIIHKFTVSDREYIETLSKKYDFERVLFDKTRNLFYYHYSKGKFYLESIPCFRSFSYVELET